MLGCKNFLLYAHKDEHTHIAFLNKKAKIVESFYKWNFYFSWEHNIGICYMKKMLRQSYIIYKKKKTKYVSNSNTICEGKIVTYYTESVKGKNSIIQTNVYLYVLSRYRKVSFL